MAGHGRHGGLLKRSFRQVEMLEQSPSMTKGYDENIIKHETRIQAFEWPGEKYQCIMGCWCFGYLDHLDREDALTGIYKALKTDGFLVFFESVVDKDSLVDAKRHWLQDQQLIERREEFYDKFFERAGFEVIHSVRYNKDNVSPSDMMGYVLKKKYS